MVHIEIKPCRGAIAGSLIATGHADTDEAGKDLVCCAITTLCDCLVANLRTCWGVSHRRNARKGSLSVVWRSNDRNDRYGIERANSAAGFAYNGFRALAKQYPLALEVRWVAANTGGGNKLEDC